MSLCIPLLSILSVCFMMTSVSADVVPLNLLYWRSNVPTPTQDNYVTTKAVFEVNTIDSWDYLFVRREGYVMTNPAEGTIPLFVYYDSSLNDHVLSDEEFNSTGYSKLYQAGYAYKTNTGHPEDSVAPLYLYYSAAMHDHFSCATHKGIRQAEEAGYKKLKIIAYVSTSEPPSKFPRVTQDMNGTWWVTRNAKRFMTIGVNHANNGGADDGVGGRESSTCKKQYPNCGDTLSYAPALKLSPYYQSTMARYGSESAWSENTKNRLLKWNFNTVSGWSATLMEKQPELFYCHLLDIGTTWFNHSTMGDVFGDQIREQMFAIAENEVAPRANDTNLVGWQLDNEFDFGQDFLAEYLTMNVDAAGRRRAVAYLEETYKNIRNLDVAWNIDATSFDNVENHLKDKSLNATRYAKDRDAFLYVFATQYFNLSSAAIRTYDTNHMILGMRFGSSNAQALLASAPYVDWIDQHMYSDLPNVGDLYQIHQFTGKPVIVGEFSFTALDSNLPNTRGARANHPYVNQTKRAAAFSAYAKMLAGEHYVVGYHWWQWADEPATGRWPDGEDSNYGLVHIDDDDYDVLTTEMTKTNALVQIIHANLNSTVI